MSDHEMKIKAKRWAMIHRRRELLAEIRRVFDGVSREGGVSLHQLDVLDGYGSEDELAAAKKLDVDQDWTEVSAKDIEELADGWPFFDPIGFRYYLPAFMTWYLKTFYRTPPHETNFCIFYALSANNRNHFSALSKEQSRTVGKFVKFAYDYTNDESSEKAYDRYWSKLEGNDVT